MSILTRYIAVQFLCAALMMIVGLSAILLVFDVLAHAGEVTQNSPNILKTLGHYIFLRLPGIIVLIVPIAVLIAAMTIMYKMVKSREMIVLGSMGLPIYKVSYILASVAFIIALAQFCMVEFTVSTSTTQLRMWAEQNYQGAPPEVPEHNKILWVGAGPYIVHYESSSADGHILFDPLFIRRTDKGQIEGYIRARRAIYDNKHWVLENAYSDKSNDDGESVTIKLDLKPDDFSIPAQDYAEIRFLELWPLVFSSFQDKTMSNIYSLWFQLKLAQPLSTILMAMMAAPIGLFLSRQYNAFFLHFAFLIGGFIFFVGERLLLSMGESSILPPFLAAWSLHLIFGIMILWFTLYKQE